MSTVPEVETITEAMRDWTSEHLTSWGKNAESDVEDAFAILSLGFPGSTAISLPQLASVAKRRGEELTKDLREAGDELAAIKRAVFNIDTLNWNHPTEYVLNRINNLRLAESKVEELRTELARWIALANGRETELTALVRDHHDAQIEELGEARGNANARAELEATVSAQAERIESLEAQLSRLIAANNKDAAEEQLVLDRNAELAVELAEAEKRCSDLTRIVEEGTREIARMATQRDAAVEASNRDLEARRAAGVQLAKFMRQLAGMVGHPVRDALGMPDTTEVFTRLAKLVEEHGRATRQEATELSDKRQCLKILRDEKEAALAERDDYRKRWEVVCNDLDLVNRTLATVTTERDELLAEMANAPNIERMLDAVDADESPPEPMIADSIPGDDLVEIVIERAAEIVAAHIIDTRGR